MDTYVHTPKLPLALSIYWSLSTESKLQFRNIDQLLCLKGSCSHPELSSCVYLNANSITAAKKFCTSERNNSAGVFIRLPWRSALIVGNLGNLIFVLGKQQATDVAAFSGFGRLLRGGFAGCSDVTSPQNSCWLLAGQTEQVR